MVEGEDLDCDEQRITHLDSKKERELPMVFFSESTNLARDDLVIFPPINHENLYINGFNRYRESPPSEPSSPSSSSRLSHSSLSPSDSDEQFEFHQKSISQQSDTVAKSRWQSILDIDIVHGWWKLLLARLLSKFQNFVICFSKNSLSSVSKTLRSFYPVFFFVIWWWMRHRTRRRLQNGEIVTHLRDTIKERDERISQLLHQIAQMSELLVKMTQLSN